MNRVQPPHWKTLLREAQEAELKAARLRVERLRALRKAQGAFAPPADSDASAAAPLPPPSGAGADGPRGEESPKGAPGPKADNHCPRVADENADSNMSNSTKATVAAFDENADGNVTARASSRGKPHPASKTLEDDASNSTSATQVELAMSDADVGERAVGEQVAGEVSDSGSAKASNLVSRGAADDVVEIVGDKSQADIRGVLTPADDGEPKKESETMRITAEDERRQLKEGGQRLTALLVDTKANWTERKAGLIEVRDTKVVIDAALALGLSKQLADARSALMGVAAEAICARGDSLALPDALVIGAEALEGIAVKKNVMWTARARAFAAALRPHASREKAWEFLLEKLDAHRHDRARAACVDAVIAWVAPERAGYDMVIATVINRALMDNAPEVRERGKALYKACQPFGEKRVERMRAELSKTAKERLPGRTASVRISVAERRRLAMAARAKES